MKKFMALWLVLLASACQSEQPKPMVPPVVQQTGGPSGCSGSIYGTTGVGLVGQVSVALTGDGVILSRQVDGDGRYFFHGLTSGTYQAALITVPEGYKATSPTVVSVNLAEKCSVVEVDFELVSGNTVQPASSSPAVSAPPNQNGFQLTNPFDEAGRLLNEAKIRFGEFKLEPPLKEMMFLSGGFISLMGPVLECLKVFAYISYLPYLWVLFRWIWRKESWKEIIGPAGKWLAIILLAGAPGVYLTSFHEVAKAFWWADNSFVMHALGWDLASFSPDLNPESVIETLKHLILLTAWHVNYEILLFVALLFVVPVACLTGDPKFLFAWGFAWVAFWLFGIAFWLDLTFIDSYRSTEVFGIGANFLRSMVTRLNSVFIGSTGNLAWAFSLAPIVFLFWLMFFQGREAAPAEERERRVINLNEVQDWLNTILALLGIRMAYQNQAAQAAWAGNPPTYQQLGSVSAPPARPNSGTPPPVKPIDGDDDAAAGGGTGKGAGDKSGSAPKATTASNATGSSTATKNSPSPASWKVIRPMPHEAAKASPNLDGDNPAAKISGAPRDFKIIGDPGSVEERDAYRMEALKSSGASAPSARTESAEGEMAAPMAREAENVRDVTPHEADTESVAEISTGAAPKARVGFARMTDDYVSASVTLRKGELVLIIDDRRTQLLTDTGDEIPAEVVEFVGGER